MPWWWVYYVFTWSCGLRVVYNPQSSVILYADIRLTYSDSNDPQNHRMINTNLSKRSPVRPIRFVVRSGTKSSATRWVAPPVRYSAWQSRRPGRMGGVIAPLQRGGAQSCYGFWLTKKHEQYNVRPPRYLSWFITSITMVYGTYNYTYWGL